jgi:hypothetical protein
MTKFKLKANRDGGPDTLDTVWTLSRPSSRVASCCLADSVANLWSASWLACPNSKLLPKRLPSSGGQR